MTRSLALQPSINAIRFVSETVNTLDFLDFSTLHLKSVSQSPCVFNEFEAIARCRTLVFPLLLHALGGVKDNVTRGKYHDPRKDVQHRLWRAHENQPFRIGGESAHYIQRGQGILLTCGHVVAEPGGKDALPDNILNVESIVMLLLYGES